MYCLSQKFDEPHGGCAEPLAVVTARTEKAVTLCASHKLLRVLLSNCSIQCAKKSQEFMKHPQGDCK